MSLGSSKKIKEIVKRIPIAGPIAREIKRAISPQSANYTPYEFARVDAQPGASADEDTSRKIQNVLNYTKTSGSSYSAHKFPAGYHTIELGGLRLQGQRDPKKRFDLVPVDFRGKSVLDLGSNQGGMLLTLADQLKSGVGVDYDTRMVNAANRIKTARNANHLQFYALNLESEPLDLIRDFLPEREVDVVFLLSVCMWLKNWRDVISFAADVSKSMLFETNGTDEQQDEQEACLRSIYTEVTPLAETSEDDPGQKRRKFFYCSAKR